jgi:hypothetical protein
MGLMDQKTFNFFDTVFVSSVEIGHCLLLKDGIDLRIPSFLEPVGTKSEKALNAVVAPSYDVLPCVLQEFVIHQPVDILPQVIAPKIIERIHFRGLANWGLQPLTNGAIMKNCIFCLAESALLHQLMRHNLARSIIAPILATTTPTVPRR